jgi:hypothetical protein
MNEAAHIKPKGSDKHLIIHYLLVLALYASAIFITVKLLTLPAAHKDFIASLSSAAILATLGSAIATVGSLWAGDRTARIALDVDIIFKDIFKQEAWRRWPFLLRSGSRKLLDGSTHAFTLSNPVIPLNVGSHHIKITLPTVQEDFFDLPLFSNLVPLVRYRNAAHTTIWNAPKDSIFPENKMTPGEQYMAYECLADIWISVFVFRVSRYVVHFGAALTVSSALLGGLAAWTSAA